MRTYSSMMHLSSHEKKKKLFPFLGTLLLLIGVSITLYASKQNSERRQFAQTPVTYPNSYPTAYPTGQSIPNPPEIWATRYARLAAKNFYIRIGNKYFYGTDLQRVHTDPGLDNQTLEASWIENGIAMRLNLYFRITEHSSWNGTDTSVWELYDVRSSDANGGNWIYYKESLNPVNGRVNTPSYSISRRFIPTTNGIDAEIICNECRIEAFNQGYVSVFTSGYALEARIGESVGQAIEIQPFSSGGYGVNVVLRDANNAIVYDRTGMSFRWQSDSINVAQPHIGSIQGLSPYIASNGQIEGINFGTANITVSAIRNSDNKVLAETSFPVRVIETGDPLNLKMPECTVGIFADNPQNNPPNYTLSTPITQVSPKQQFVMATNFYNKTQKQYRKISYNITLGEYLEFVDSNGSNCSYQPTSKVVSCVHGLFVDTGATSMAFRVKYLGASAAPVSLFGTAFTSNGDTGSCSTTLNKIPLAQ